MFWPGARRSAVRPASALGLGFGLLVGGVVGCARPQGVLFEPVAPARVWPEPPDRARVRYVGSISDSTDLKAAQSGVEVVAAALRGPRPPLRLLSPHGVDCRDGRWLAITDGSGAAVHIVDLVERTHLRVTGCTEEDRLEIPVGVTWAGERLFVTDAQRGQVLEFDAHGQCVRAFGKNELNRPVGIAFLPSRGHLYVSNGGAHRLEVFTPDGDHVRSIGGPGLEPGEFNYPTHLARRGEQLIVADAGNFRVQLLDADGKAVQVFGQKGDGAGDFSLPKGVAADGEGHIYVVDAQFENVQIFNEEGRLLMAFGGEGRGMGEFWLPAGIDVDEDDRIWVADSGNRRIQVFDYLGAER